MKSILGRPRVRRRNPERVDDARVVDVRLLILVLQCSGDADVAEGDLQLATLDVVQKAPRNTQVPEPMLPTVGQFNLATQHK